MSTGKTTGNGKGGDFTLPDFATMPGFEEAARKLYDAGATSPDAPKLALASKNEKTITEGDVRAFIEIIRAQMKAANVDDAKINEIIGTLDNSVGTDRSMLEKIKEKALAAVQFAVGEASKDMAEKSEAKFNEAVKRFDDLQNRADKIFDSLDTTEEEKRRKAKLEEELEAAKKSGDKKAIAEAMGNLADFNNETGNKYNSQELVDVAKGQKQIAANSILQKVVEQQNSTPEVKTSIAVAESATTQDALQLNTTATATIENPLPAVAELPKLNNVQLVDASAAVQTALPATPTSSSRGIMG